MAPHNDQALSWYGGSVSCCSQQRENSALAACSFAVANFVLVFRTAAKRACHRRDVFRWRALDQDADLFNACVLHCEELAARTN